MLARMVASEFTSDAAIRFKLGRRATEATKFESVNDSLGGPAPEFESDGRIRYKLGCDHPSQLFWHFTLSTNTAGINRSNTAVRAVLEQLCLTGGWTGTVQPKHMPAGWRGLSDQFLGPVTQDQPGPVGQICPTSWLLLWSDSACPTTS
ncbi:hypothetical protein PCASD_16039 [Puccinia coronata f. sp. avenae]|uniref:Uncharacterized protein n=1 Tax=Puccinia coronata f. sp. avenae TaxID=200324 RepID=A0A2N5TZY4_9BASI|nr:hypothetical protein PCASD_16039 [Puccinia coronata f. sp. avenae]